MKKFLVPVITAGLIFGFYQSSPYSLSPQSAQLIMPAVRSIQETVTLYGTITDSSPKLVYAPSSAKVVDVFIKPGDTVEIGDPLLLLEPLQKPNTEDAFIASVLYQLRSALEQGDLEAAETAFSALEHADYSQQNLDNATEAYQLYSSVNGVVLSVSAAVGQEIGTILPCIQLCDPHQLLITAKVGEDTVGKLDEGMNCSISVPAFSLNELKGTISTISPYAKRVSLFATDSESETEVQIRLENAIASLRPGYRATSKIVLSQTPSALLVPYEAVAQDDAGREFVMKYIDGIAVKQFILTSAELYDSIEVVEGLSEADLIFLNPETIEEGSTVILESQ